MPERAMVVGELVALLTRVTLPAEAPVSEGAKVTPKGELCPGVRVRGVAKAAAVKPVPAVVI